MPESGILKLPKVSPEKKPPFLEDDLVPDRKKYLNKVLDKTNQASSDCLSDAKTKEFDQEDFLTEAEIKKEELFESFPELMGGQAAIAAIIDLPKMLADNFYLKNRDNAEARTMSPKTEQALLNSAKWQQDYAEYLLSILDLSGGAEKSGSLHKQFDQALTVTAQKSRYVLEKIFKVSKENCDQILEELKKIKQGAVGSVSGAHFLNSSMRRFRWATPKDDVFNGIDFVGKLPGKESLAIQLKTASTNRLMEVMRLNIMAHSNDEDDYLSKWIEFQKKEKRGLLLSTFINPLSWQEYQVPEWLIKSLSSNPTKQRSEINKMKALRQELNKTRLGTDRYNSEVHNKYAKKIKEMKKSGKQYDVKAIPEEPAIARPLLLYIHHSPKEINLRSGFMEGATRVKLRADLEALGEEYKNSFLPKSQARFDALQKGLTEAE